jgi:hypothetical protein
MLLPGSLLVAVIAVGAGPAVATAAEALVGATGSTGSTGSTGTTGTTGATGKTGTTGTTGTTGSTGPVVPVENCIGDLSQATPTDTDPHLLNYSFHCDGQVNGYTILVTRPTQAYNEIDDFSTASNVIDPNSEQLSSTLSYNCQGGIPGSGFDCQIAPAGSSAAPWSLIQGQFDTTTPFCPTLPAHAKPGTKPSTGAVAYLIVSDPTPEIVGPWLFQLSPRCPVVKPVPKPKPKKHTIKKHTIKKHATKKKQHTKKAASKLKAR